MQSWLPVAEGSPFTLLNLPFAVASRGGDPPHVWVAIGDDALDITALEKRGLVGAPADPIFREPSLNRLMAAGPSAWRAVRDELLEVLTARQTPRHATSAVASQRELRFCLPATIGDYIDFYSSFHHAENLGRILRPGSEPVVPHWWTIPLAYNGRSSTLLVSGTDVVRPYGVRRSGVEPSSGPTAALDFELEVGFFTGPANRLGVPISVGEASDHIFGLCLVNDWSARDIQAFEYVPLGPFLGKSFATSLSPWVVTADALARFRQPVATQDRCATYLACDDLVTFDIALEVTLQSTAMRSLGHSPVVLTQTNYREMYWTPAQQLAHATANGALARPGDLLASGTISGAQVGEWGSLIEITRGGVEAIRLPTGETRTYLEDGDCVVMRGWAGGPSSGVGFGEVRATILPAIAAEPATQPRER